MCVIFEPSHACSLRACLFSVPIAQHHRECIFGAHFIVARILAKAEMRRWNTDALFVKMSFQQNNALFFETVIATGNQLNDWLNTPAVNMWHAR